VYELETPAALSSALAVRLCSGWGTPVSAAEGEAPRAPVVFISRTAVLPMDRGVDNRMMPHPLRCLRWPLLLAALLASLLVAPAVASAAAARLQTLVGALHEHSAYSDGWPGTRPRDYYESGARYRLDFLGGSDHSDNMGIPAVFSEGCYRQGRGGSGEILLPECALADQTNPADSFRKWDATAEQARAVSAAHPGFGAFRGFEWSSDRYGHISVYFSTNYTSAYTDGGFVDMPTFWRWFTTPPSLGGGGDGLATFNHPGAKKVDLTSDLNARELNWDDFAYVAAADRRVVGIEVFNDKKEYGSNGGPYPEGSYAHALDKGWHVGASAAEDLGHRKPPLDNWGGPQWAKTVVLAAGRTAADIRAALLARHFYAVGPEEGHRLRLAFSVDRQMMGERLSRPTGASLPVRAKASDRTLRLELVTSGGRVVAAGTGALRTARRVASRERWYFVRARRGKSIVAYSSPVWVEAGPAAAPRCSGALPGATLIAAASLRRAVLTVRLTRAARLTVRRSGGPNARRVLPDRRLSACRSHRLRLPRSVRRVILAARAGGGVERRAVRSGP